MCVPDRVLTNADLEKMVDTSDEWITTRTGIRERRIADENTATSDLAISAAAAAMKDAGVQAKDIDLVIVGTVTPDMSFPATACFVQAELGLWDAATFDLSAGCSGFVYGLDMAANVVATGAYDRVLVIGADCLSKITDFTDRSTCVLFGDGAGAAIVEPVAEGFGFLGSTLGSDGSGTDKLYMKAGGSRCPASESTVKNREHYIRMAGNEVFKFAVNIMAEASRRVLSKAGMSADDVNWFIPHQANTRIIDAACRKLGIPAERVFVNVDRYGNTSAASIAIALAELRQQEDIRRGDNLLLVGFGAGLTWAATLVKWY